MSHSDPTVLALAALGEPLPSQDRRHLDSCPTCRADMDELISLVALGREAPRELPAVPDHVWDGIRDELGLRRAPDGSQGTPLAPVVPATPAEPTAERSQPLATVVPLAPRRRTFTVAAVAAAAGALFGGSVVWATADRATDEQPAGSFVAQAVLEPLTSSVSSAGTAEVMDSSDGQVIRVDARGLPASTGFYEVWLLDAGATKLVALGALPSGSIGTFTVPPGVSVTDFPVVDISLEPYDGDPGHSHDSLMRGVLEV